MTPNLQVNANHSDSLRGVRVLVADDCPDHVALLTGFLTRCGCLVYAATNGEDAIQLARTARPAIALLDIEMPRVNGYDVAAELRRSPGLEQIPLIALTGYAERHHWLPTIEAGFTSYVAKPIDLRSLATLLESLGANTNREPEHR